VSSADIQESWHVLYGTIEDMPRSDKGDSDVLAMIFPHKSLELGFGFRLILILGN
jgi:hypothetical protein